MFIPSDPLVTKLDFDKEPTPGPKHYVAPEDEDSREPLQNLVPNKLPDKEEVQVQTFVYPSLWVCVSTEHSSALKPDSVPVKVRQSQDQLDTDRRF